MNILDDDFTVKEIEQTNTFHGVLPPEIANLKTCNCTEIEVVVTNHLDQIHKFSSPRPGDLIFRNRTIHCKVCSTQWA